MRSEISENVKRARAEAEERRRKTAEQKAIVRRAEVTAEDTSAALEGRDRTPCGPLETDTDLSPEEISELFSIQDQP